MSEVTDRASDAWSQFDGVSDAKLWQIQVDHAARPGALYDLRGRALSSFSPLSSLALLYVSASTPLCIRLTMRCLVALCLGRKFGDFLEEASRSADGFPKSLEELSKAGIKLVLADSHDPDSVWVLSNGAQHSTWPARIVHARGLLADRTVLSYGTV